MLPFDLHNSLLSKTFSKPATLSKCAKTHQSVQSIKPIRKIKSKRPTLVATFTAAITLVMLGGCNSTNTESSSNHQRASHEQKHGSHYVVGDLTQGELFEQYPYFAKGYESFALSQTQIAKVKSLPRDVSLDIYFGAWCHDSQREVPRLLKAMSVNSNVPVSLIALDIRKHEPQGRAATQGVKYTPTIIVKRNGKELGRIIERPKVDLISDIVALVK